MTTPSSPSVLQYQVLYYKQTRKVHKSKGVSKSDGVLSINTATGVVSLFEDDGDNHDENSNIMPGSRRLLYSSLNPAISKRSSVLEVDETVQLGGFELDIVCKLEKASRGGGTQAQQQTVKSLTTATKTSQRLLLPQKRPLAAAMTTMQQSTKVVRENTATSSKPAETSLKSTSSILRQQRRRIPPAQPLATTTTKNKGHSLSSRGSRGVVASSYLSSSDEEDEPATAIATANSAFKPRQPLVSKNHLFQGGGMPPRSPALMSTTLPSHRVIRRPPAPLLSKKAKTKTPPQPSVVRGGVVASSSSLIPTTTSSSSASHVESSSLLTTLPPGAVLAAEVPLLLSHIPLPAKVSRVLRPHQVTGVNFLYRALQQPSPGEENGGHRGGPGAILADEPGLGKTLMTIAVIASLHRQHRNKHFCVVCPSSLVTNWTREFDKWLGREGQPKRVPLKKGDTSYNSSSMKSFLVSKIGQVVIMSYELFRIHSHHFSPNSNSACQASNLFALLVVDEGHRLKNKSGSLALTALEQLPCDARLLLSATPIQNNLTDLYTLANFCRPGVLGDLTEFRRRFERPILAATATKGNNTNAAQWELDKITSTFMLRRLQKDVLKSMLPPRIEVLLFCCPSPRQCELYKEIVASASIYGATSSSGTTDALSALTSLRKVCSHPLLHDSNSSATVVEPSDKATDPTAAVQLSGKLVVLKALLSSMRTAGDSSKVVAVSNFTSTLTLVETLLLKPLGFSYVRLDGSTGLNNRQTLVDTFNKQNVFCFLLSSKAGGCGLNLIGANRLVLLDPSWNPADDIQAMGRIYRQGQTRSTTIYRLFTSGTIEEVIFQRQCRKGNLAGIIDKKCAKFSQDEINDCFTLKEGCDCDTKCKLGQHWHAYDGASSLRNQGCSDVPLMEVAKAVSDTLKFVHIVREEDDSSPGLPLSPQHSLYDSDEEEEFEFDMKQEGKPTTVKSTTVSDMLQESSESDCEFEL